MLSKSLTGEGQILMIRRSSIVAATLISLAMVTVAHAGDLLTGVEAHDRGDFSAALREWRPLAEQGHAGAQNNLGLMYNNGQGVPEDYVQAYAWYNIAAAQGHDHAENNKKLIAESMTRGQRARAQELARQYWEAYVLPFRN